MLANVFASNKLGAELSIWVSFDYSRNMMLIFIVLLISARSQTMMWIEKLFFIMESKFKRTNKSEKYKWKRILDSWNESRKLQLILKICIQKTFSLQVMMFKQKSWITNQNLSKSFMKMKNLHEESFLHDQLDNFQQMF